MFSIDFPEIVIIFGVALVVLGPKKLPGAAAQIGRWVGRARAMARQFREQLEQEVGSVESSLDIRKAMETETTSTRDSASTGTDTAGSVKPQSAAQASGAAEHPAASDGTASEHPGTGEHVGAPENPGTPEHLADWEPPATSTPPDMVAARHAGSAGEPHAASDIATGSEAADLEPPSRVHWPESAGGWSPDSLIRASMPSSEPDGTPEPDDVHTATSAGEHAPFDQEPAAPYAPFAEPESGPHGRPRAEPTPGASSAHAPRGGATAGHIEPGAERVATERVATSH